MLRKTAVRGGGGVFMMELPKYQLPHVKDIALGLWQRAMIFLKRAGGIILVTTIILWALASFPVAGPGQKQSDVSIAGKIADGIHVVVAPIGFNKDISLALLPAMAAREVAVSAIATVYSIDQTDEQRMTQTPRGTAARALALADRAGVPRLVRVRPAMHLDHRRHAARDQWLALAAFHGDLPVRARLSGGRSDLLAERRGGTLVRLKLLRQLAYQLDEAAVGIAQISGIIIGMYVWCESGRAIGHVPRGLAGVPGRVNNRSTGGDKAK